MACRRRRRTRNDRAHVRSASITPRPLGRAHRDRLGRGPGTAVSIDPGAARQTDRAHAGPGGFSAPTSPLSPLPTPQSLEAAIERDVLRLASLSNTNGVSFDPALSQSLPAYADWYAALQNAYGRWGPITPLTPYTIFETGTLPSGVAWVKLGQFRNGDFFRHMRFYRWHDNQWVWTLPDPAFWQGSTASVVTGDAGIIGPIVVGHPIEDAPVIDAVFGRFTRAYQNLCESLKCPPPIDATRLWTPGLTLTLAVLPQQIGGHGAGTR